VNAEPRLDAIALSSDASPALRAEASLALAKYQYRRKQYEAAETRFTLLAETAPAPTMVTEARLYLARIFRNTGRVGDMALAYRLLFEPPGDKATLAAWELGGSGRPGRWAAANPPTRR
jgi:hypothetical protein